jgi:hypothetical protein
MDLPDNAGQNSGSTASAPENTGSVPQIESAPTQSQPVARKSFRDVAKDIAQSRTQGQQIAVDTKVAENANLDTEVGEESPDHTPQGNESDSVDSEEGQVEKERRVPWFEKRLSKMASQKHEAF